ncbi:acyltransferase family protein [Nocardia sp. NPDC058058]|uniref:acyltransferase family protein n=1 Tax=Nocardia sp. NPDC058058 TaxID=3346317 RepID=UPI0036DE9172
MTTTPELADADDAVVPGTSAPHSAIATRAVAASAATSGGAPESVAARANRERPALPSLTGARWWAACAVFAVHALVFLPVYPFQKSELFRTIHQWFPMQLGAAGVTFFFVLSGFIIYWSFRPGNSVRGFYRRRVLKIYPTHLLGAAAFIVAAGVPLHRLVVWAPNLLLIHTWVPKWTMVGGLNVPSWSLAAEVLFYLSFPLALPLIRRIPSRRLLLAMGLLVLFVLALHTAFYLWADGPKGIANIFVPRLVPGDTSPYYELHSSPAWFAQPDIPVSPSYWLSYTFPASRLPEFYLGVLAARMVLEGRWRTTKLTVPLLVLALSYVATWVVPVNYKMSALMLAPMTAVVATLGARDMHGIKGITSHPRLVWLGNITFAFYLVQLPVMVVITRYLIGGRQFGILGWAGFSLLSLVVSLALGALLYHLVDVPIMRRFAGRSTAKPVRAG